MEDSVINDLSFLRSTSISNVASLLMTHPPFFCSAVAKDLNRSNMPKKKNAKENTWPNVKQIQYSVKSKQISCLYTLKTATVKINNKTNQV